MTGEAVGPLANQPHTDALSRARMRVEALPPIPGGSVRRLVSRTGPENQDDCPPPTRPLVQTSSSTPATPAVCRYLRLSKANPPASVHHRSSWA
jgi:hypothetical protein